VVATRAQGSWGDYGRLLRELWRGMRGGRETQIALVVDQRKRAASVADALIESVENPVLREGFRHFAATLADGWSQAGPALRDARKIVAATEAAHFVSAEVSGPMEWALAEAAGERGALRWVLSRNTHAPATSALALDSTRVYFKARYPDGLVDRYLFWTPGGAATARQFLPDERWPLIEAVAAVPVNPVAQESNGEMRRVLVADTLATFWLPLSWIYQTADEFIDGLGALIEAVEKSPKTELAIRAKLRPEIELDAYAKLLRASPRVTVKARDFDFARDLAQADLLIASRSTTIEEAIHGRRPVLLWGGSRHYRYMPARETPPRPGDRAAVYAANGAEHLALMLRAILECHSGIPLTDQEMAAYVWPDRTPTITDLAARLVSRPQRHVRPAELEMAPPRQ
ncbi:MAG: hypothetical protein HY269_05870, partial [Deltaproteobacteria bacterium]|nr:hypothetical protein [Deltaproteobacteria bacterium]